VFSILTMTSPNTLIVSRFIYSLLFAKTVQKSPSDVLRILTCSTVFAETPLVGCEKNLSNRSRRPLGWRRLWYSRERHANNSNKAGTDPKLVESMDEVTVIVSQKPAGAAGALLVSA